MTTEPPAEDVFYVVTLQHREIDDLFEQIERARLVDLARAQRLFDLLARELSVHTRALERVLYPRLAGITEVAPRVTRGRDEQRTAMVLVDEMRRMSVEDQAWIDALHSVCRLMRHHMLREESRIFPEARAAFDTSELRDLARQLRAAELEYTR
jgi:hemerythrin superfamily protein